MGKIFRPQGYPSWKSISRAASLRRGSTSGVFNWRDDRGGVELPHGRPHGEDPQVARAREEVLAAPGAEARHAERDLT
jgi:hypothetical protein